MNDLTTENVDSGPRSGTFGAFASTTFQTDLSPSAARAQALDAQLRRRLADSLDYVGNYVHDNLGIEFAELGEIKRVLCSTAVSAWVFCLFSKLVAELSNDPPDNVTGVFEDIRLAVSLPPAEGVIAVGFQHPKPWWEHFQVLIDTDRSRPLKLETPAPQAFECCKSDIHNGLALMQRTDTELHNEVTGLLRTIVLGSPAAASVGFNGVSTFFNWGATTLNADVRRSAVDAIDLLVHESSHLLLFGLSSREALTQNTGEERHASPLRADERPIDGIFHACFVTTRVHLAMNRLTESGGLDADEAEAAQTVRSRNARAAREALALLKAHSRPTATGERVLAALSEYWT